MFKNETDSSNSKVFFYFVDWQKCEVLWFNELGMGMNSRLNITEVTFTKGSDYIVALGYFGWNHTLSTHVIVIDNRKPAEIKFEYPQFRAFNMTDSETGKDKSGFKIVNTNIATSIYLIKKNSVSYMDFRMKSHNYYRQEYIYHSDPGTGMTNLDAIYVDNNAESLFILRSNENNRIYISK